MSGTLPLQGSDVAAQWDQLYWFLIWLSVFFFVVVVGGMIYFAITYSHRKGKKVRYITDHHGLELFWTVIPTVLLMVIFAWGYVLYDRMVRTPADAMEIRVVGKQWLWNFQYDDGRTFTNEVFVPMHKPIKFVMTSEDVIHSFFIPNFRVKQDVVPGMYTSVWFEATVPGQHQVFCTEYCGGSHSLMLAKVIVLDEEQWSRFSAGQKIATADIPAAGLGGLGMPAQPQTTDSVPSGSSAPERSGASADAGAEQAGLSGLQIQGKKLLAVKGCVACHSDDGSPRVGPSFKGVYGHPVALAGGGQAVFDDAYFRESVTKPNAKVVKGYGTVMPTFQGQLTELEMNAMMAYVKGLR